MADLNNDLRLAVDTGSVVLGTEQTMRAINSNKAKLSYHKLEGQGR